MSLERGVILLGEVAARSETITVTCRKCRCDVHCPDLSRLFMPGAPIPPG